MMFSHPVLMGKRPKMTIRFDGRVAIVTGGGNGLGKMHCLQFAQRGAKVVVNDLGGAIDGSGRSGSAAQTVAEEIERCGGEAMASEADVTKAAEIEVMVAKAKERWGRIDILVNNAGILRDKSFSKMTDSDFEAVLDTHLRGAVICTRAVWDIMRAQEYGRIIFTSSGSGLFGNFGQANYAAAKMALVGLMNALHHEGEKSGICVNTIVPSAATRMTEGLAPHEILEKLDPALVSPGILYLASKDAPSKTILSAGAGVFSVTRICDGPGVFLGGSKITVDDVAEHWKAISDSSGQQELSGAWEQAKKYLELIDARTAQAEER